jgi:ABC-type branched-subunit amino acid transport system substrate-binding protein
MSQSAIEIFFSYVHEDEALRDKLAKHLQVLQREEIIKVWHDRKITAGEDWKNKIDRHLESANIILLLISSDFLNSDYHYDIELKRALERHESKEARVIPVILRAVDLRGSPFEKLSALPENGKAITSWDNEDEAFTNVVKGLRQFIDCFPADPDSRIGANPYKGLSAFEEADGDQFFGRKPQIKELWEKFCGFYEKDSATRLLTIYGPSGSGKSSLAMAGLIYELDQRPLPDRKLARVAVLKPNTHPLESLKLALERIAPNDHIFVKKIRDQSLTDLNADGVHDGLRQIADTLTEIEISPLIVLVDQLEDVFTLCEKPQDRDAFIGNLLCAAANRSKRVSVIVTLRSDFLGAVQKYPEFDRLIQPQGFFVAAMTVDGLREAITEPAKLAGHPLDLSTVNLLIEQTSGREGTLPLLQFALTRIWEELAKKEKPKEPAETLKAIGGVGGALAGEAQRIYKSLTPNEQEIARRVFLGLVQLGEGTKDTRRRIKLEQLIHQDEQVQKVIDQFASRDTRLITLADDNGAKTVEVTHEALFDNWQQLKDWLNDGRNDLRFQRRLDDAVMVWQGHGKPEGNLWRSPDLDLLRGYQEKVGDMMTKLQLEFFYASSNAEIAQKEAENRQVQKDKATTRGIVGGVLLVVALGVGTAASLVSQALLYNQFVYCPQEKGRPGKKIEDTCFRPVKTSGEFGVFLSNTNFHLIKGMKAFRDSEFENAVKLFEQAVAADPSDPVSKIFLNNAKARSRAKPPIKLAVVASIDYYEAAAKEVLRGVADAQDEFNQDPKNIDSLIEIVIVNDENEEKAAKEVAQKLLDDWSILGIMGHHASESTLAAQKIYKDYKIAVISPTSSSSELEGEKFFRAIGSTKKAAKAYTYYIREVLRIDSITIFYKGGSGYSETLKNDIREEFLSKKGKIDKEIDIGSDKLEINKDIDTASQDGAKVLLIISNVSTNSVAVAISRKNFSLQDKRMILISSMSLSEQETIEKGGKAVEGMILVRPCLLPESNYTKEAIEKWQRKEINWRQTSSYDATQAFIEAIKKSKSVSREEILNVLGSKSEPFYLSEDKTSGFGLKWDVSDRSNANQKYCVVQIKNGKFVEIYSSND